MGRKSKLVLYDILNQALQMYNRDHKTLREIAQIFKSEGYDVTKESVRTAVKSANQAAMEYNKAYEESRAIIDAVKNNPNTEVYETITSLLAGKILDQVKNIEELTFDDPVKMTDAVSRLANSQVKIARFRLEFQKGYEAAKREFMEKLNKELAGHPDLLDQIVSLVAAMEADA